MLFLSLAVALAAEYRAVFDACGRGHMRDEVSLLEEHTHGDVVNGLERSILGRFNGLPVQVIQRINLEGVLGLLFRPLRP